MSVCDNCALRIYNPKHYNLQGIGSPYYGNCIVIPNVDYNAYKHNNLGYSNQIKIILEEGAVILSTGELQELVYFCPIIRCNELVTCPIDKDSFNLCLTHFVNDVRQYDLKFILLLGEAVTRILDINIGENLNNAYITKDNRIFFVNYSPLTKFTNERLYNEFVNNLRKWINAIKTKDFTNYNLIKL